MAAAQQDDRGAPGGIVPSGQPSSPWLPTLTALGVVFGDIGTSPLYAMRLCFTGRYAAAASAENIRGVLSLITWSLILVISVKYLVFVLRADNGGEGGILALMVLALRAARGRWRKCILPLGLFGAALLYGDGMITPAISVLSAIEGIRIATPVFESFVVPVTIGVLAILFFSQRLGTSGVGRLFGPVMLVWFAALGVGGAAAITRHPAVLMALSPLPGAILLLHHGLAGLIVLGVVFLAVTGGEALYADIGHFGPRPIRLGWYAIVLPALLLNYFGQGAFLLAHTGARDRPFYQMLPAWSLYPMVVLATLATVIASQAIISGAFSLTFQGFQLGYLPRLDTRHTSANRRGQIYVPAVNWILLAATVGLVVGFRRSENLGSAYGVAIATTMVITSLLFFVALRRVFSWPRWAAGSLTLLFLMVDLTFFAANMWKFADGGWFPLLVAALVFLLMTTWRRGFVSEHRKSRNRTLTVREFLRDIGGGGRYRRVPGQAVYLTGNARGTPHSLRRNLRHNRVLHASVVLYTAKVGKSPRVPDGKRLMVVRLRDDISRVIAAYGYMETPDVPRDLAEASRRHGLSLDLGRVTYFVGGETLLADRRGGMGLWRASLYALMARNEMQPTHYFNLPPAQVFEIGTQIEV
jgi:KUP system potassium uptake protein